MIKNTHQIFRNYSAEKNGKLTSPKFFSKKMVFISKRKVAIFSLSISLYVQIYK